jgi:hypothetical protein
MQFVGPIEAALSGAIFFAAVDVFVFANMRGDRYRAFFWKVPRSRWWQLITTMRWQWAQYLRRQMNLADRLLASAFPVHDYLRGFLRE